MTHRLPPANDEPANNAITLRLTGVAKTYRAATPGTSVTALRDVSFTVPAQQSLAITGPSGSGKSTLLHLIGAMDVPDSGHIEAAGVDLAALNESERTEYRRRIGFVFQRFHLLPALTAVDNVAAPLIPYRSRFDKHARALEMLDAVGLADRAHFLPGQLSGGQQQRVAIARALVNRPGLILADEPTGNLDSHTGSQIMNLLLTARADYSITLIIATHDLPLAARCDRTLELADGDITKDRTNRRATSSQEAGLPVRGGASSTRER